MRRPVVALIAALTVGMVSTAIAQTQAPAPSVPPAAPAPRIPPGWENPDVPLALPNMPLHDPFMVADKATRTYYLYTSNIARLSGTPGLGTMAYTSKDLKNWTRPKAVFILPQGTWADGGAWAPEVHFWKGRWYIFTTFHNEATPIPGPAKPHRAPYRRATVLAVSDTLDGPFKLVRDGEPPAGADRMTLDGGLYVDRAGKPWMVYAGEWLQETIGTIEALPLTEDLAPSGPPKVLFRASDAVWADKSIKSPVDYVQVTDGPQMHRTKDGALLMLWSSYDTKGYVQSIARSRSGEIEGPWEQLHPLLRHDSGHGMLFETFEGQLMMVVHRPFKNARGKLYEMRDVGNSFEIVRHRIDLDGDPAEVR